MSPELSQEKKVESPAELASELRDAYGSVELTAGSSIVLEEEILPMNFAYNRPEGVFQDLIATIKAGDDFFSVVDATLAGENEHTTLITHHTKDGRAEIVGHISNGKEPLFIGRNSENGYSAKTSRDHFFVAKSKEGKIGVMDTKSSNGTEVFATTKHMNSIREKPEAVKNGRFWSGKSSVVRDYLESIR